MKILEIWAKEHRKTKEEIDKLLEEPLSIPRLLAWAELNCRTKEELDLEKLEAEKNAKEVLRKLEGIEITTTPLIFNVEEFKNSQAFAKAMFLAAEKFKSSEDIIVRYSSGGSFSILKSKAKVFKNLNPSLEFTLSSAKEIKSAVKYFNSLGVKDLDGENLEPDVMKESLLPGKFIQCRINNCILTWSVVDSQSGKNLDKIKEELQL